jgi:hypothetical protein
MTTFGLWTRKALPTVLAAFLALVAVCAVNVSQLAAQSAQPCAQANARLAATGHGDRDRDGLSNCSEKRVFGTDHRDYDSDDDGLPDPDELEDGTDPTDADSDDDGLDDGEEGEAGSDPGDADSDEDGLSDGTDCDPAHDLESEIEGPVQAITCPTDLANGSLTVLGVPITLTPQTEFEHMVICANLVVGTHVGVELSGDATTALIAEEVEVEDGDNDGCPGNDDEEPDDGDGPDDHPGDDSVS